MNKKLKSYHKLFFTILFSILFFNLIGSENNPNLSDKIAPELERIEALPRRTKPAELNIEVTKLKSETLDSIYFSPKEKALYIDFSKYYNADNFKNIDTNRYELFISDKIENAAFVNSGNNRKQIYKSRETVQERYSHKMVYKNNKKLLMIENIEDSSPKNLYLGIFDKNTNQVVKVFKANFEGKIIESVDIERREAHIIYSRYSNLNPNTEGEVNFTIDGISNKSYVRTFTISGFTNAIPSTKGGTTISARGINAGPNREDQVIEQSRAFNESKELVFNFTWLDTTNQDTNVNIKYLSDGTLTVQVKNGQMSPYIIDLIHKDLLGNIVKIHRLNIYSEYYYQAPKLKYTFTKYDFVVNSSTKANVGYPIANVKIEQPYHTTGTLGDGLKIVPMISLNELNRVTERNFKIGTNYNSDYYPYDYINDGTSALTGGRFPVIIQKNKGDTGSRMYLTLIWNSGIDLKGKYGKETTDSNKYILLGSYTRSKFTGTNPLPTNTYKDTQEIQINIELSQDDLDYINSNNSNYISYETPTNKNKKIFIFTGYERNASTSTQGETKILYPGYKTLLNPGDTTYIELIGLFPDDIYNKAIIRKGIWKLMIDSRYNSAYDIPAIIDNVRPQSSSLLIFERFSGDTPKKPQDGEKLWIIYDNDNKTSLISTDSQDFILEKGNKITLNLNKDSGNIEIRPTFWNPGTQDEFILKYTDNTGKTTIGEYTFKIYPPSYFISGSGVLDFGDIVKGSEKDANTTIKIDYAPPGLTPEISFKFPSDTPSNTTNLYLKHEKDQTKKLLAELTFKKESSGNGKIEIPLSGKIKTTKDTEIGKYSNQMEILIHLK